MQPILLLAAFIPGLAFAQNLAPSGIPVIVAAEFLAPTLRYEHGVFGDYSEFGALSITIDNCFRCTNYEEKHLLVTLPEHRVFEDTAPRMADLDGDGRPEVIVVETDVNLGAQLAVYGLEGLIATTPEIGTTRRWLALAGIADFDGDGQVDIAYIETPHLGKTLLVWTMRNGNLVQIGTARNLTNHRFGEDFISGGVRDCGQGVSIITADGNWRNVVSTQFINGILETKVIAPYAGQHSFEQAMRCG